MLRGVIYGQRFLEELNALVDEANNLVRKLHDDEDSDFNDNFNDWHQMVIIKRDLMQLYPLVCYELVLRSIEKTHLMKTNLI